jgi:hypothetical protein
VSDLPAIPGLAYAYANHGRWVADCPRPYCSNAMQIWPGDETFRCEGEGSCGWTAPIVWPPDPAAIEVILQARPSAGTRNWYVGETLLDLLQQNAEHDCVPQEWLAPALATGGTTPIMSTEGEVVTAGGILPTVIARRRADEIDHEIRKAIGN